MKKILLSLVVIFSFVFYSLHERSEGSEAQIIVPKQSTSQSSSVGQPSVAPSSPPGNLQPFKDGAYTGDVTDAFYGNIQVRATIASGRLTTVDILQYPSDRRTSEVINGEALPILQQEAIQKQSAQVDIVSGATDTSMAFQQSLSSALQQAR